jgi:hypothetical protein
MSAFTADLRAMGASMRTRIADWMRQLQRTKPGPALARLIAGVSALAACVVVLPLAVLVSAKALVVLPMALGVALWPRTRWVTVVAVACTLAWLLFTLSGDMTADTVRVVVLAGALYLMHTGAALAAVLPYDCVVSPGVLVRWGRRVGAVLAVSLGLGLAGLLGTAYLEGARSVIGPIVGSAVVACLVGLLAWQARRRQ